jgi:transposase
VVYISNNIYNKIKMKNLTKDEILSIPELKTQGKTNKDIAHTLGVSLRTIQNWAIRLRKKGHKTPYDKKGRKPII